MPNNDAVGRLVTSFLWPGECLTHNAHCTVEVLVVIGNTGGRSVRMKNDVAHVCEYMERCRI